ncbi:hypothetical protein [Neobacillus vireti]|uniref:hypothetical protein n=1 Tax=Neobacillus vireti TaxID=220686 RepID=UPI002FFF79E3
MKITHAGFKEEKEVLNIPKSNLKELYISRIPKVMNNKSAAAVVEKLTNHIDRVQNIQHELIEKKNEVIDLQKQSATLEGQYQKSMDRKILRAKMECDAEIDILEKEIKTLSMKTQNLPSWKLDIPESDLDVLASAYNPLAEREMQLYEAVIRAHKEFVQARNTFIAEYKANQEMYGTILELASRGSGQLIEHKLDRIPSHKINELS